MNKPIAQNNIATCTLKGLAFCLNFAYIKDTIAKSIVRRGNLSIFNKRRTNAIISIVGVFLCLPFNGGRAWDTVRCAGSLLCQFSTLRMATALIRGKIIGSFFKLTKGTIAMSIPTHLVPKDALTQYIKSVFNLSLTHCTEQQLADIKNYVEVLAMQILAETRSQSLKDKLSNQVQALYLNKPTRKILTTKVNSFKGGAI